MTINDFEIFFFATIVGTAALGVSILVCHEQLRFMRSQVTNEDRRSAANLPRENSGTSAERRRAIAVPTITCSLPIPTLGRSQQRLW